MAPTDTDLYRILINDRHQHSLWPVNRAVPPGWRDTGERGSQEECLVLLRRTRPDVGPSRGLGAPAQPSLHGLIIKQAARTPDAVAVVDADNSLTYAQLDDRSAQLARRLQAVGVSAETVVALCIDRSVDLVVALLGILRSGGAYLPLDPSYPAERLAFMLTESGASVLVADSLHAVPPAWSDGPVLLPDKSGANFPGSHGALSAQVTADQVAYMIYTSGSAGTPKGVQITHGSLTNLLLSVNQRIPVTAADTLLAVTTVSFDIAVLELFAPLLAGGRVVIAKRAEAMDGVALTRRLAEERVTILQGTPTTWQLLLDSGWRSAPELTMLCGGEALQPDLARNLLAGGGRLWNMYGPTEATIWSSAGQITLPVREISLGEPLANTSLHLLDRQLDMVAPGETGEICIAGAGLARGYAGRPELTARSFVANPYADCSGERLYRTGDLARRLPDGTLHYLGRIDDQVKVRGHRVEPQEIEHLISGHSLVRQAVVTAAGESPAERHLVAWLVSCSPVMDGQGLVREVRAMLQKSLPGYLVPSRFLLVDELPQTPAGKTDRRLLTERAHAARTPDTYTEGRDPGSALERELARTFGAILHIPHVAPDDNFFHLGGHSLLAARLLLEIRRTFQVNLSLEQFFREATVAGLAAIIAEHRRAAIPGQRSRTRSQVRGASDDLAADVVLPESITPASKPQANPDCPRRILLTGSTGYLGAHLLADLLARTDADIVCLVRAPDRETAARRQEQTLRSYRLEPAGRRVTAIPGDLAQPGLGLPDTDFTALAEETDAVYHCGARVNLVLPYSALRSPNVHGTREVLRLACTGRAKPVHYVSTMGVLRGSGVPSPWREDPATAHPPGAPDGYVRSKWVAERLLGIAAKRGLPVTIHRPFLALSHSTTGACRSSNYLAIVLRGLLDLGTFPDCDAVLNIVPVDFVSRAIVHLSQDRNSANGVFHFANPRPATLRDAYSWLRSFGYHLTPVTYRELREHLLRLDRNHPLYPVLPLLQARDADREHTAIFNQPFDCTNTWRGLDDSGITCEPVEEPLVHRALTYLVSTGFLQPPERQRSRLRTTRRGRGNSAWEKKTRHHHDTQ